MSRIVPWESLETGHEYYEEWRACTACLRCKVLGTNPRGGKEMRYWGDEIKTWSQTTIKSREFRYWDSEPTIDERQEVRWA